MRRAARLFAAAIARRAVPLQQIAACQPLEAFKQRETCFVDRFQSHYGTSTSAPAHTHAFEDQEKACWSCDVRHKRGGLVCNSCDKLQPVDSSLTYFDLLGLRHPTFDIDPAALERRYKLLQWQLHPDKAVNRSPQEQEFSAQHAALLNQAYGVLRAPLPRANYMLMLHGMEAAEGTIEDPELLMQVMEAREEVDETEDPARLQALAAANRRAQGELMGQLGEAFRGGDLGGAAALTKQLTYLVRIQQAIEAKL